MRIIVLIILSFFTLGIAKCGTSPKEPKVHICTIYEADDVECRPSRNNDEDPFNTTAADMQDYRAVSLEDFASSKAYYEILLLELERCRDK